jgi:LysM repeat protein
MGAKKKSRPDDGANARTSEESEMVSLYRGFSREKPREAGAIFNHTTLSVWAATFILCSVLVFGLHQVRGRLDGIQATLEQSEQDKKLLLEGMDELLVRTEQPASVAETESPPQEPLEEKKQAKAEKSESKSEPNNIATKYKIYYRTKAGEDLTQVGEKFGVSEDQLCLWNALKATDSLIPGQVLVINKSTQTDNPFVVAKAPSPPDAKRVDKTDEAGPEGTNVDDSGPAEGTGDSLAAGGPEQTPEVTEDVSEEPVDETVHVVQEGESLSIIGQQYGVSWLSLAAWNGIEPPGTIYVGQRLRIPEVSESAETSIPTTEVTHKVQKGENLYRIGRLYDLTWKQIARVNGITDPSRLRQGQVLKIPVAKGGPEQ